MIREALIVGFLLSAVQPALGERLWLVVGASDPSAAGIAKKAHLLARNAPTGLVVRTGDCGDLKSVFAWVSEVATSAEGAQAALSRLKGIVRDSYVKRCDTRPGTLLSLRMSAVDASIADVPENAVNWEENDRISTALPLPDGRAIVIVRSYVPIADDPLEGRRERVVLVEASDARRVLEESCHNPGPMATRDGRIAFHCASEQAGNHLFHTVVVFDGTGKKLTEILRCRNPKWSGDSDIECEGESVGPDGRLILKKIRTHLGPS